MKFLRPLLVSLFALLALPAMACYVIYDRKNEIIYDKFEPPVNMKYQLHQTMPQRAPGGHLVFSTTSTDCSGIDMIGGSYASLAGKVAPKRASGHYVKRRVKRAGQWRWVKVWVPGRYVYVKRKVR